MKKAKPISLAELQARPLPPEFDTISGPLPSTLLNDLQFRMVFEANQEALKALLCSLLHLKESDISELVITNPIRLGDTLKEKVYIFDLYLLMNNQKKVHLELQILRKSFWTDRTLCYLCRDFGHLNPGESYQKVKPLTQIDIIDFDLYENSKEFYSTYHLANDKTGRIYSDKLALHVLDLNKGEYATENDKAFHIDYWARLFKSTTWEELRMIAQEQQALQSTVETIYRVNADDYTRTLIEAREDFIRQEISTQQEYQEYQEQLKALNKQIKDKEQQLAEQEQQLVEQEQQLVEQEQQLVEQEQQLTSFVAKERMQIKRKIQAGKSLEQTAAELETEPESIRELYEKISTELLG